MKVGVIGAGRWGKNHVKTLHAMGALGGVADLSADLRAGVERDFPGVAVFAETAALLASDVQAVVIATPVSTHAAVAKQAILAGKDVLVEKPLTMNGAEADELVALARARGRILMVGHMLLYQPAIQFISNYLRSGALGEVRSLHQERLNLGTARSFENALWSLGVHDVAVLTDLIGESPSKVSITGQRVLQPTIEDDIYLHMAFPSGAQAHLHCSWLWPEKRRGLTVVGSKGMLVYDELAQTVTLHRKTIDASLKNVDQGSEAVFKGDGEPLRLELEHFIHSCQTRDQPLTDGVSGARVVRVLEQAVAALEAR